MTRKQHTFKIEDVSRLFMPLIHPLKTLLLIFFDKLDQAIYCIL